MLKLLIITPSSRDNLVFKVKMLPVRGYPDGRVLQAHADFEHLQKTNTNEKSTKGL